jgi:hypothetical protein
VDLAFPSLALTATPIETAPPPVDGGWWTAADALGHASVAEFGGV